MTHVKICGITNLEDALVATEAGADLLGFIFYPPSPRSVTPERACQIVEAVRHSFSLSPSLPASFVGVFVDAEPNAIRQVVARCGLDYAQLHGAEPPEMVVNLRDDGIKVIKAFRVRDEAFLDEMERYRATAYLLDAYVRGRPGGTGHTFEWNLAVQAKAYGPILLAGGLTPDNVAEAVRVVRPWGVDTASGVEASPVRKDHGKVRPFIAAAKCVSRIAQSSRGAEGQRGRGDESSPAPRHLSPSAQNIPDERGYFGPYGGKFVPETLMPALDELEQAYEEAREDPAFQRELKELLHDYAGRPTPLYFARRLTAHCGDVLSSSKGGVLSRSTSLRRGSSKAGARIYLKREDLAHTGAHKINNTLGQGLLARRMGKERLVAETGAGQHGVATATAAALLGMECVVYMGTEDMRRQAPNVSRMRLLGAEVRPVDAGSCTLKDAINEAIRDWVTNVCTTHYLLGSILGPHPYPMMVRDFQAVIGRETRAQILKVEARLPDCLVACVGGGSNAIGLFHAFLDDDVEMVGVEAGGLGLETGKHAARFADPHKGRVGVLHGTRTYVLQDEDGQILTTHSVSAGLDYPAVGPEHSYLRDLCRAEYTHATDEEALEAFQLLCRLEGIIPALESAHAVAEAIKRAPEMGDGQIIVINLSGRGDKDLDNAADAMKELMS